MTIDLTGKVFLVTGGSRGIGRAIVKKLTESGASVAFTYHQNQQAALDLQREVAQQGRGQALGLVYDLCEPGKAPALLQEVTTRLGTLDGLINNAGVTHDFPFYKMPPSAWHAVIDTNLTGTFYLTQQVIPTLVRKLNSKIVNIASVSGIRGSAGQANYSAAKAALIAFTKTLALEFARLNVQINAVAPGFIETEMTEKLDERMRKQMESVIPLRRMGRADEVAEVVAFLLSPTTNYITGQTIIIDGGLSV